MIEIIKDKKSWDLIIGGARYSDTYHTYDYHLLSKSKDESPVLIHYFENGISIAIPLLIRKIENTPFSDATSVYGYPGPVTSNLPVGFDNSDFKKSIKNLFLENKIVSVFSRLNPFIPYQEAVLQGMGEIATPGKIINIDITQDIEEQKKQLQKRLRTYINKSRKLCSVRFAKSQEDIEEFIRMYYENMKRVNANQDYFFKKDYFFNFLAATSFHTEILLAIENESGNIIGGVMFIKKNEIVQYHLSGAKQGFLSLNPIKLLIDEMRIKATEEGYKFFNLGGGVGSKNDSLFHFKSGFSKDVKEFKTWRYIVNDRVYESLVRKKQNKECLFLFKTCQEFFPCYRCQLKKQ